MIFQFKQTSSGAILNMLKGQLAFKQINIIDKKNVDYYYTIAWNKGKDQKILIDGIEYEFKTNMVLPLMTDQYFSFENAEDIMVWQFNREFYCVVNHDAEVGCVGFLFYGLTSTMFLSLDKEHYNELNQLQLLFEKEFTTDEEIKETMLKMLLVSLIIRLTRLAKKQYIEVEIEDKKFDLFRKYNLLVEKNYRKERQVQFYAGLLNKSPKTISNIFAVYSKKTPLEIIHDRVILEAKRLFYYTDKSVKEIANDLGFDDASSFSKFFKNYTTLSPSEMRKITPAK